MIELTHSVETCARNTLASPRELWGLLVELARKINRDAFTTSEWITLEHGIDRVGEALVARLQRQGGRP